MFYVWTEFTVSLGVLLMALGWTATRDVSRRPRVGGPTSGLWPLALAAFGLLLPFPLPDYKFDWILRITAVLVAQAALTRWYFSEERVRAAWRKVQVFDIGEHHDRAILRTSAALVVLFVLGWRHGEVGVAWVMAVSLAAAIFVDVRREMMFRRTHGYYAEVISTTNIALAEAVSNRLCDAEIPVMVRGLSVARLLRFGWREIDVLVPATDMARTEEALLGTQVTPLWTEDVNPDEVEQRSA